MSSKPITARQLAEIYGVSPGTVNKWVRENRIPYLRVSRRIVRFDLNEVQKALHVDPKGGCKSELRR